MSRPSPALGISILAAVSLLLPASAAAQQACENLKSLKLSDTTITMAQLVAAGSFTPPPNSAPTPPPGAPPLPPGGGPGGQAAVYKNLTAFCRVAATLKPSDDSDIKIEVWLPAAGWNGKFQATGNGGWAGTIGFAAMGQALARGYVTAGTDTGHTGDGGSFALGHPEKLIDFGYRAVHLMTVEAKEILTAYYGTGPRLSYWVGCSSGGREGLKEAQKYPQDFDAIVAGAPANNWTNLEAWTLWGPAAMHKTPESMIPPAKFPAIHKAVLDECDALDGVKDGLIQDPRVCDFQPQTLLCQGQDSNSCLTAAQVQTLQALYSPAINPRTKEVIYPGFEPGTELGWNILAAPDAPSVATDTFKYETFQDPNWNWRTFNYDSDVATAARVDDNTINAVDPDLRPFFKTGGKLIQYHGWSDPLIAPESSIDYYGSVAEKLGGADKIDAEYRLFMVPGMAHCGGGEGPNMFDMLTALEQWREQGKAPDKIIASRGGAAPMTRPLCPYPQTAQYAGSGDTGDAASFICAAPGAIAKR